MDNNFISSSPAPAPLAPTPLAPERVSLAPAPLAPEMTPESINRIDLDNTLKVANNYETNMKIKNIITNILNVNSNDVEINQQGNDLVIKINGVKINNKVYSVIIPKIKTFYFEHYKKLYNLSKNEIYKISEDNISIDVYDGSIIMIVKIYRNISKHLLLTDEEKDLLEYYNFVRVFHKGLRPITTYELKKMLDEKYKNEQK